MIKLLRNIHKKYLQHSIIGIDINSEAIHIAEKCRYTNAISRYIDIPLDTNPWQKPGFIEAAACSEKLQAELQIHAIKNSNAVITVPTNSVMFKNVILPIGLTAAEIEQHILLHAEQHFGQLAKDIYIDFITTTIAGKQHAQVIAVKKTLVENRINILKAAKVNVFAIDVEAMVLVRLSQLYAQMPASVWLHCNCDRILIVVVIENKLIYFNEFSLLNYAEEMLLEQLIHQLKGINHLSSEHVITDMYLLGDRQKVQVITNKLSPLINITVNATECSMAQGLALWQ